MNTKDLILSTAFRLFASENFESVSMSRLEKTTGLSKGAFYHHFKSKEEIFIAAMDKYYFEGLTPCEISDTICFKAFIDNRINDIETKAKALKSLLKLKKGNTSSFGLMNTALLHYPDFASTVREKQNGEESVWESVIISAQQKGELNTMLNPKLLSGQFLALIDGTGIRCMLSDRVNETIENTKALLNHLYNMSTIKPDTQNITDEPEIQESEKQKAGSHEIADTQMSLF